MSKFDDFNNNFDDNELEDTIKKAKRKSNIKNVIVAFLITIITIFLAIILNNYIYIKSSNKAIAEIESNIESTIPNGYVSSGNFTQSFLGGKIDYNVSKVVGDRVVTLERNTKTYGFNPRLTGMMGQSKGGTESEWGKVDTWESGHRKMVFFHPDINYKEYLNDLKEMDNMSDNKVIEIAISLDKAYSKDDIFDLAYDMRNLKTKWIWLDTFSKDQINEFKQEVKENDSKYCGIGENEVRGINYRDNKGNIYTGMIEFSGMYNSWIKYLSEGEEATNYINELNKNLYNQLVKDGKDSPGNIKILGFVVEGTKDELKKLLDKPYIKASTFGVAIDPIY